MKDKPSRQTSINDLVAEYAASDPVEKQSAAEISELREETYTEDMYDKIVNYNNNVTNLDELYSSIQPLSDILVRVFLQLPTRTNSGLLIPIKKYVPVPTRNGIGNIAEVESPFPYTTKAVIISVPKGYKDSLYPGQIVQLASDQVEAQVTGSGDDAYIRIKNGFLHADANLAQAPKDPSNKHYGYLLIPSFEIKAILNNATN